MGRDDIASDVVANGDSDDTASDVAEGGSDDTAAGDALDRCDAP